MTTPSPAAVASIPPHRRASGKLLRVLGAAFSLSIIIGGTIGVGILASPGAVAMHAGSASGAILLWIAGGVYALLGAAAFTELGTGITRSGGPYVFVHHAFGNAPGFVAGWADLFAGCTANASLSVGVVTYASLLWPALAPWTVAGGVALIVLFALSQLGGIRFSSRLQEAGSALKALLFLGLIGGLLFLAPPATVPTAGDTASHGWALPGIVGAVFGLQMILQTYDGWAGGIYFAGEDRAPGRNLPRAMLGGVLLVIAIYILMNLALMRVLPFPVLAASTLPAADAARAWLGESGGQLITAIAAVSLLPTIGAVMLVATRIVHAIAADGLFPARLGSVDARGTPVPALLTITAISVLLIVAAGGVFELLFGIAALFNVVVYTAAFTSLLVMRRRQPDMPRPFRAWGFPYTTWLLIAVGIALFVSIVVSAPRESLIAIVVLGASYPVYRLTRRFRATQQNIAKP